MPENVTKFGTEDITDLEMFAAKLNKQFGKYNDLLGSTATKAEIKQMQADLIVENKEILDKITAEGDKVEEMKKQLLDFTETIKVQGSSIAKMKTAMGDVESRPSFKKSISKALDEQKSELEAFHNKKNRSFSMQIDTKAVDFGGTYGSGAAQQSTLPFQQPLGPDYEAFDVRTIVPTGTIDQNNLSYPQERSDSRTNNEGWKTENAEGTASDFGFTMVDVTGKYYKDHIKVSRFALRDTSWLQNYLSNQMLAALIVKLNTGVIADDGTSQTIDGLLNNANAFTGAGAAYSGKFSTSADYYSAIAAARADLKKTYHRMGNTVMLDPVDAAIMADSRDTTGRYINSPFSGYNAAGLTQMIGGMRLVEAEDITDGSFLVADIQPSTVQLLFAGPIDIMLSMDDDDNFTKDLVTIKIGANVMLPIYKTTALLKGVLATVQGNIKGGA